MSAQGNRNHGQNLLDRETAQQVHRCVSQLDDKIRLPLILYYFRELSLQDTAEILGIPVGTVKSRLYKARSVLRNKLEVKFNE